MIDIDHFKHINDTHGHEAGDDALRAVAGAVATHARSHDLIARFGGEEFCLLVPDMEQDEALLYFEELRQRIAALEVDIGTATLRMTVSIGLCCLRPQRDALHRLISEADRQLYRQGRWPQPGQLHHGRQPAAPTRAGAALTGTL